MYKLKRYKQFLYNLLRDNNFVFIVLAAILVSLQIFYPATEIYQRFINAIPYAFGWLVFAWAITDKSIQRRIFPYLGIFVVLFFEKSYWYLFYVLYPPEYVQSGSGPIADALAFGSGHNRILDPEWFNALETAQYVFIVVKFIVMFVVFLTLWYLARPSDFRKMKIKKNLLESKKMVLLVVTSFVMTMPHWLWRIVHSGFAQFFTHYWEMFPWSQLLFYGFSTAVAFILFAFIITKIQNRVKYLLYAIIGLLVMLPYLPREIIYSTHTNWTTQMLFATNVLINSVSYFFVFLSLLLLAKTKYIER